MLPAVPEALLCEGFRRAEAADTAFVALESAGSKNSGHRMAVAETLDHRVGLMTV